MGRERMAVVLSTAALAAGCTQARDAGPAPMPYVGPVTVALSDADPRVPDLVRVDIGDAVAAPSVVARPPGRALLVAVVSAFDEGATPSEPGEPVVLAADGTWRRVLPTDHGVDGRWGSETPFDLSDDGRVLALVEEGTDRVVVVDLDDGSWRDLTLPTRDAVGLELGRTGASVTFADRDVGLDSGWRAIDVATGEVTPAEVPWDIEARVRTDEGSAGLGVGDARLVGTPRELEWLGPVGGDPARVVAAVGLTGRVYRWVPVTGTVELVARVGGAAVSLAVASEVLDDVVPPR